MKTTETTTYQVVKTLTASPGPGLQTVRPETTVVMSTHLSRKAAELAQRKYSQDHRGYASFEIVED